MKTNGFFRRIVIASMFMAIAPFCRAQFVTQNNTAWTTGTTWSGNVAPNNWANATATVNHNVTTPAALQGFTSITLAAARSLTSGSAGTPQSLTLQSVNTLTINGAMTVFGDLTITGSTAVTLAGAGSLTVTGTLTISGSSSITNNGTGTISAGAVSIPSGSISITNNSALTVTNAFQMSGSSTFSKTGTGGMSVGSLSVSGGTFTFNQGSLTSSGAISQSGSSTITSATTGSISATTYTSSGSGGTLNINNGSLSLSGAMTLGSATTVNVASVSSVNVGGYTTGNNADAILNNNGNFRINGNANVGGVVNNNSTGSLVVTGDYITSGSNSSVLTSSGALRIGGSLSLTGSSRMQVNPHANSLVIVDGNTTVGSNENLVIGTNVAPTPYASMVVRGNLIQTGSGDVRIRRNGRFAVFGNVTDSGGGDSRLNLENGAQVYVHGNINYTGGSSLIGNANSTTPFGLYVNGTTSNTGGGSSTTSNSTDLSTLKATNVPFYNWLQGISDSPLPVTLLIFEVESVSRATVLLHWATASEKNFDYFAIEKGYDGKQFFEIGQLAGAGNSAVRRDYRFEDKHVATGRNYYRLKAVDVDGSVEYFRVVVATVEASNSIDLFPNPTSGESINMMINFDVPSDAWIEIYDNLGWKVMHGPVVGSFNELKFPKQLMPGTYLIRFVSSAYTETLRFAVR